MCHRDAVTPRWRWLAAFGALVWCVWILQLGIGDRQEVIGLPEGASEAVQHIVAFAVLSALVMLAVGRRPWMVFAAVAAAGVLGELAQLATSSRTFSVVDMLYSTAGAALGVVVVRRHGWPATLGVVSFAGLMIAIAPFTLRLAEFGPDTAFPQDCASPPPPPAPGAPEVVLSEQFGTVGADEVGWPIEIEEPTTAELRAQLIATNEFSVTMQFSTTDLDQTGPVRLFTISDGVMSDQVNFHVGLERNDLSIRLRTSCELFNSVVVPDVVLADTVHRVAVTWGGGTLDVWVDAVKVTSTPLPWGDLERWDPTYPIIVGDEAGGGRRFDGSVYSVVMWDRVIDETLIGADSAP